MNHAVPFNRMRHFPFVGLLLLFLLLTSCFGGGDNAAQDTAVAPEAAGQQTGSLVCSESCLNQGQCGTTADGRTVILGHSDQPATRDHNTILPSDSAIIILGVESRTIAYTDNNQTDLNFYHVQPADGGPPSWVAGSCVNVQQ